MVVMVPLHIQHGLQQHLLALVALMLAVAVGVLSQLLLVAVVQGVVVVEPQLMVVMQVMVRQTLVVAVVEKVVEIQELEEQVVLAS
jgi:hypothetical protein